MYIFSTGEGETLIIFCLLKSIKNKLKEYSNKQQKSKY